MNNEQDQQMSLFSPQNWRTPGNNYLPWNQRHLPLWSVFCGPLLVMVFVLRLVGLSRFRNVPLQISINTIRTRWFTCLWYEVVAMRVAEPANGKKGIDCRSYGWFNAHTSSSPNTARHQVVYISNTMRTWCGQKEIQRGAGNLRITSLCKTGSERILMQIRPITLHISSYYYYCPEAVSFHQLKFRDSLIGQMLRVLYRGCVF